MEKADVKIFDTPADKVEMPTGNEDVTVVSSGVIEAISGNEVKSVIIPEESCIIVPNYVIDLSNVEEIEPIQVTALDALIHEDGDIAVYIHINGSIQKIGMGHSYILDRVIVQSLANVFDRRCSIYRNYEPNKEICVITAKDVSKLRLSI